MFIAETHPPRTRLRQERHVRLGSRRGSMPLLTELGADRCWFGIPINMPLLRSLGDRAARVAINMPLLRSWWGSGGTVAINMPLVTELSGAARRP